MFLFSLVEISESPHSFVPVPICGVTRVASLKGTFFSDTLIFGWRKHGFLWIFPSTDPTELRPLYGRYHQVCFVKTPFLDVSCEYLTYHILSPKKPTRHSPRLWAAVAYQAEVRAVHAMPSPRIPRCPGRILSPLALVGNDSFFQHNTCFPTTEIYRQNRKPATEDSLHPNETG